VIAKKAGGKPPADTMLQDYAQAVSVALRAFEDAKIKRKGPEVIDARAQAYRSALRLYWEVEHRAQRKQQVDDMQDKGAAARRIYTEEDRDRWRSIFVAKLSSHSKRRAAEIIAEREKLPHKAVDTIRKALGKKAGESL
jgi:hypothetical protein